MGSKTSSRAGSNGGRSGRQRSENNKKGLIASAIDAVTAAFSGGNDRDALNLLKEDHRRVDALFAKVKANEDGNNAETFRMIKEELDVHAHVEEMIFYPHLLEHGDKELKKIVREGLEEHGQVKELLAEIAKLPGTSPTFRAKLTVLIENVEHHVEEEEGEMFGLVEDQIPEEMLQRLGSWMLAEKAKVQRGGSQRPSRSAAAANR